MIDLTAITTPFGLLDKETQDALRAHGGPYEMWLRDGEWVEREDPDWISVFVYRVKPQPPKPREWIIRLNDWQANPISDGEVPDLPFPHVRVREVV